MHKYLDQYHLVSINWMTDWLTDWLTRWLCPLKYKAYPKVTDKHSHIIFPRGKDPKNSETFFSDQRPYVRTNEVFFGPTTLFSDQRPFGPTTLRTNDLPRKFLPRKISRENISLHFEIFPLLQMGAVHKVRTPKITAFSTHPTTLYAHVRFCHTPPTPRAYVLYGRPQLSEERSFELWWKKWYGNTTISIYNYTIVNRLTINFHE